MRFIVKMMECDLLFRKIKSFVENEHESILYSFFIGTKVHPHEEINCCLRHETTSKC